MQKGLFKALNRYNNQSTVSLRVDADIYEVGGGDCMVGIVFKWQDFTPKKVKQAKHINFNNYELYLRPGDTDSHYPLKVTISNGKRKRSELSLAHRLNKRRNRKKKRIQKTQDIDDEYKNSTNPSSNYIENNEDVLEDDQSQDSEDTEEMQQEKLNQYARDWGFDRAASLAYQDAWDCYRNW